MLLLEKNLGGTKLDPLYSRRSSAQASGCKCFFFAHHVQAGKIFPTSMIKRRTKMEHNLKHSVGHVLGVQIPADLAESTPASHYLSHIRRKRPSVVEDLCRWEL